MGIYTYGYGGRMREGTLEDLIAAIWELRNIGWRSHESIQIIRRGTTRWKVSLGDSIVHTGDDLSDALAGLYQELRRKAEEQWESKQGDATRWREACDFPVPSWAWPKEVD